jgi:hypothetical protein
LRWAVLKGIEEQVGEQKGTVFERERDRECNRGRGWIKTDFYLAQCGDGLKQVDCLMERGGDIDVRGRGLGAGGGALRAGEGEHVSDQGFEPEGVVEAAFEAGPVVQGRAGFHVEQLERGFDDSDGGFELVGGVADEGALLEEGALKAGEDAFESVGKRSKLGGGAGADGAAGAKRGGAARR